MSDMPITFFVALTVNRPAEYNASNLMGDLRRGQISADHAQFDVYGDAPDLISAWGRQYMDQDAADPEWRALCSKVQQLLPTTEVGRAALVAYLQREVFGSWASDRRIKRLAKGRCTNNPTALRPNPIIGKTELRRLIAAVGRSASTQEK